MFKYCKKLELYKENIDKFRCKFKGCKNYCLELLCTTKEEGGGAIMALTSNKKQTAAKRTAIIEKETKPIVITQNSIGIDKEINQKTTERVTDNKLSEKEMDKNQEKAKTTKAKTTSVKTTKAKATSPVKEANVKTSLVLQYQSLEINSENLISKVKDMWVNTHNKTEKELKNIDLYVKPEEYSAYYVINNSVKGRIDL